MILLSSSPSVLFLSPYYHPCPKFLPTFSRPPLSPLFPSRLSLHPFPFSPYLLIPSMFFSLSPFSLLLFYFYSLFRFCFVLNLPQHFYPRLRIRYCVYVLNQIRQETLDQLRLAEISGLLNTDCRPSQPAWIGYVVSVSHSMLLPMPCLFGSIQRGYTALCTRSHIRPYAHRRTIYTTGGTVGDYLELRAV